MAVMKTLASIVQEVEAAKSTPKKADLLRKHSSAALKCIVGYAVDPLVKWLLPEGDPPYTPLAKSNDAEGVLYRDYRKLIYLIDSDDGRKVSSIKREQIFMQLLESVDPDDALLLLKIKNKDVEIPVAAVKQAWPNLTAGW